MLKSVISKNAQRKLNILAPFFSGRETLLDFGCGDMKLAKTLISSFPRLKITGVDVVDFGSYPENVTFVKYSGTQLPFKASTFDTVLAYHVLHHCSDPRYALSECVRVARKRIILVEPVPRMWLEKPVMKLMDSLFNGWKDHKIPMNFQFLSKEEWFNEFRKHKLSMKSLLDIEILPIFIPSGRSLLFELKK